MSSSERLLGIVKDVVLPVDAHTRYDVYFTDRRVAIVCLGKAERFESETEETLSYMPSAFGVPAPIGSYVEKAKSKPSIDEEAKDLSLDALLKLSKKSCVYTNEEIEEIKLILGKTPKFVILSRDCESKFAPDEDQFYQLIDLIPLVDALKDKLWITGKWTALYGEGSAVADCVFCGFCNDADAVYCQSCGKKLGDETADAGAAAEVACGSCGAKNRAKASFCKGCGKPLR